MIFMEEFKFLKILDRLEKLFGKFGVDYFAMRKILQVKLTLDSRRTSTISENSQTKNEQKDKNLFLSSLLVYVFMGLFLIPLMFLSSNYLISMGFIFGMFMFLMMTSLIADFSNVLLDVRDKSIILARPVNSRTLNIAKILHIFNYVFIMTMAIIAPSLIVSLFKMGLGFFLLYLGMAVFIDLFVIMLTALIYLGILRFFSGEKLRDIINYIQIGIIIFITLGFQILVRVFDISELLILEINPTWWSYILPPLWFSAPFELLINGSRDMHIIIYSILALLIPIFAIILYVKLIPAFETNLQKLSQADNKNKDKNKIRNAIAALVTGNNEERAFYKFATSMLKNERTLKLKIYPNLGFSLLFPFLMMISGGVEGLAALEDSKSYFTIYFIGLSMPTTLQLLGYSESYKASFLYKQFSINLESVYRGTLKAMFINLITPVFIVVSIGFLFIFKQKVMIHLIIAYLGIFLSVYLIFKSTDKVLPFSKDFGILTNKRGIGALFITIAIYGALAALHFISTLINYGEYIYIIILILANILAWKYGFKEKKTKHTDLEAI